MQVSGAHIQGMTWEGKDQFSSIPGLIQLNEMDFEVVTVSNAGNEDIVSVGDKSGNSNRILGFSGVRRAQLMTVSGAIKSMRNIGAAKWSTNFTAHKWEPIIRQQPFGIFALYSRNSTGNDSYMIKHGGNEPNKVWFIVNSSGQLIHIYRNSSNTETSWGTPVSTVPLDGSFHALDLISYGTSEVTKLELFIDEVSQNSRTTTNITGTELANKEVRFLEQGNAGAQQDLIMVAVYDWTGFSKTQIQAFQTRINAIRQLKYGGIF